MANTLINKAVQIRDYSILSGLISSGTPLTVSGDLIQISGNFVSNTSIVQTGFYNSLTVSGDLNCPFLSGILGASIVGSGNIYFSSVVDVSGNNLNYYVQYTTGDLTPANIVLSAATNVSNAGWTFLDNGAWSPFPVLGLNPAQQGSAIVRHEFVASGLNKLTPYFVAAKPIYAGNITGQFFDSAKFYPDSQGFQVALVPAFKQLFDNLDSRYVIKTLYPNANVISGSYASGIPIFFQSADGGFPTVNLGTGMAAWNNSSTGFFIYGTGIGFSGWRLINNVQSVTGISGVRVNQPTGNIVLFLDYGTGSGQPPSGNDLRFFSSYHQSGGPDPLNIGGLSGVSATGQPLNVFNQATYVGTYPNLSFSGRGVTVSGDVLNNRNFIILNYVQGLLGNFPSPTLTDGLVNILGTGNMFVSGVNLTGTNTNILYVFDTGTQAISVASGITITGTAILSGAGNTVVSVGAMTSSGQVIIISGSSTGGGGGSSVGGVTGFSANNGPIFTGAFSISGSGAVSVTTQSFGVGISGFIISMDHTFLEFWNTCGY